jgi:ABC-2 type transport system permease protein
MMRLLAVIDRDLRKFRRNPVVLAMSILLPLVYLIILGNSFQGKLKSLPVAVVNQDLGPHSRDFMDNLRALSIGPRTITIERSEDEGTALEGVKKGRYKALLIIPPDYTKRILARSRAEVGLFLDNSDAISADAIRGSVNAALRASDSQYIPLRENPSQVFLRDTNLYKQVDYAQSLVPGVVIMAIFLGALTSGAFNLVMDRFLGVDECYMLTPLTKFDIVAGLIVSGLSITTLIAVVILVVSMLMTGISFWESGIRFASLLVVIVLTTLSLLSLTFLILGRLRHPRVVGILSGFLNVILFFPSGAVYPVASFPSWLKVFAKINPEAYAVSALKAILFKGATPRNIIGDLLFLACFTIVMMTLSVMTFKRTL